MNDKPSNLAVGSTTRGVVPGSGAMFDGIARRYDFLNRIMSLGMDRRWRKQTIAALNVHGAMRVLDLATGTADLAIDIARRYPRCTVSGLDPSSEMLAIGKTKAEQRDVHTRIDFHLGVAESLPFGDNSFDAVSMAFGIRNCTDRNVALREMARVARPGARIAILELSQPRRGWLAPFARFHVQHVIPRIGGWLSGSKEYRYLQSSIDEFPAPDTFAEQMSGAGLSVVEVRGFASGSCFLYRAEVSG